MESTTVLLARRELSPVVALNAAVARAECCNVADPLVEMDALLAACFKRDRVARYAPKDGKHASIAVLANASESLSILTV